MSENLEILPKAAEQHVGWLDIRLPKSTIDRLTEYITFAREKNKKELLLFHSSVPPTPKANRVTSWTLIDENKWFYQSTLNQIINEYNNIFPRFIRNQSTLTFDCASTLSSFWVTVQRQNQNIPSHDHTAVFSFVVWMKMPVNGDEKSVYYFQYLDILGNIQTEHIPLGPEDEGRMLFFPAQLNHGVYPFHFDSERLTVSGNIKYDPRQIVNNGNRIDPSQSTYGGYEFS